MQRANDVTGTRWIAGSRRTHAAASGGRRHGHHLESMTPYQSSSPSVNAYLLEAQSNQISPRSDLKRRSFWAFLKMSPQQEEEQEQDE